MQELFKRIITKDVKPFFSKHGYLKKDLNFYKPDDTLVYKFNIQKSKANTWNHVLFYINCSIHSTELALLQSTPPSAPPLEAKSHFTTRIEQISPSAPDRYSLTPDIDPDKFSDALLLHLQEALTFMHSMTSARAIVDYYMERTALHLSEETFRFLLLAGDTDAAGQYLKQLQLKYGAEKRWAIFEKKYKAIFEEYGVRFQIVY
ncbi:DUF4304 domain-containing protein [Paenibacillus albidus]|uniref:DUF4304 domain-containing protein n=1 Tax=Paenibacillus albidus TaxID=2041023 RepID=UPI001BEABAFE|nr:DUF4304 domain-containing protein [Paenibacillus albidus]MBT2289031.1 DUF4304 domain-containing protein [Paenibacillus albidus]